MRSYLQCGEYCPMYTIKLQTAHLLGKGPNKCWLMGMFTDNVGGMHRC